MSIEGKVGFFQLVLSLKFTPRDGSSSHARSPSRSPNAARIGIQGVSPQSGRKTFAHGTSRGLARPPSPPPPLPPARERGAEGGVRAASPRAYARGYDLAPQTGLLTDSGNRDDFVSDVLTQDARLVLSLTKVLVICIMIND